MAFPQDDSPIRQRVSVDIDFAQAIRIRAAPIVSTNEGIVQIPLGCLKVMRAKKDAFSPMNRVVRHVCSSLCRFGNFQRTSGYGNSDRASSVLTISASFHPNELLLRTLPCGFRRSRHSIRHSFFNVVLKQGVENISLIRLNKNACRTKSLIEPSSLAEWAIRYCWLKRKGLPGPTHNRSAQVGSAASPNQNSTGYASGRRARPA